MFWQLLKFIPPAIINSAALKHEINTQVRTFSPLSHLGAMLFVQLAHALSLNDVCDWLRLKARNIAAFGLTPPARNTLSHANTMRSADFAPEVFWRTLEHLHRCEPQFASKRPGGARRLLHRFKVSIHAVD